MPLPSATPSTAKRSSAKRSSATRSSATRSSAKLGSYAVLLVSVLALLLPVILIERNILSHTGGNFTLPQDESYTNIAVGKNLAFYGVWGLSKYAFQTASSSLLYPLVLVPFLFIAGAHLILPILVNAIAAILLLGVLQRVLRGRGLSLAAQLVTLLLVVFLSPLPLLVISGMEYTLFLLFLALFLNAFSRPRRWRLYVFAALLVATRYEGLVILAVASAILLYRRQGWTALWLSLAALLPVILFGILSLSKGGHLIPPALLQPQGGGVYTAMIVGAILLSLLLTVPVRYEQKWLAATYQRQWMTYGIFALIAVLRSYSSLGDVTETCINTYNQQIQAAQFVHRYYYRAGVSLNEIGAVSWFSEGRKVDLTGIANYAPRRGKERHYWSPTYTDSLSWSEGARLAILSGPQSNTRPVGRWDKIASWNNPGNIIFYALDTASGRRLKEHLREYEKSLPAGMQVQYY